MEEEEEEEGVSEFPMRCLFFRYIYVLRSHTHLPLKVGLSGLAGRRLRLQCVCGMCVWGG